MLLFIPRVHFLPTLRKSAKFTSDYDFSNFENGFRFVVSVEFLHSVPVQIGGACESEEHFKIFY
jgi:hypothetical protein